jgi:hypothetical protein
VNLLLSGNFDGSPVGRQFAAWFAECPAREEQPQIFVQIMTGLHSPDGIVADRIMRCITEVWRDEGARFGNLLAQEIDRSITFDSPKSAEQAAQQRVAKHGLAELQTCLRALDAEGQL